MFFMPQLPNTKKKLLQKQIPTLLGLTILVVALIAGLLMFGSGTGVFAPRATPQTTPKNVKLTNVTENSFSVSFYTDEKTVGYIKYGEAADSLKKQASDDRDQLSGNTSNYQLHHITVRGLSSGKTYYYVLGTGSGNDFDNQGQPFSVKLKKSATGGLNKTIYGNVKNSGGTPAEGSIVYLTIPGYEEMSALVKAKGSWALALSKARPKADGSANTLTNDTKVQLLVQGTKLSQTIDYSTTLANTQPVEDLTFGQAVANKTSQQTSASPTPAPSATPEPTQASQQADSAAASGQAGSGGSLNTLLDDQVASSQADEPVSTGSAILNLTGVKPTGQTVTINQPIIRGQVTPNTSVKITIHSEATIKETVITDANGEFELDLADLKQELEPGEHTITYTYTDEETDQEIEQTYTFTVEDTSNLLAQATNPTDEPYGSGNPYPMTTSSPTPSPTTKVASGSATPTSSSKGGVSTRSAMVSTSSGELTAGSVGTTLMLVIAGCFFIGTGVWSWWLARELELNEV
ncbi:MAG: hypothetical protein GF390_01835 [Candidatus Pacebacteria bacterium]|nr:hypothetical protein [Candidatus Paceibacterota bacterium]